MIEQKKLYPAAKVDIFIGIFLIIAGILVIIFWQGIWDTIIMSFTMYISVSGMSPVGGYSYSFDVPFWIYSIYGAIILLGITTIIYGCKRTIDSILKI